MPVSTDGEVVDTVEALRTTLDDQLPDGLEAWVTGPAGFTADLVTGFLGIDGLLLIVALGAVFIILVIVYRSPLLPILVLLTSTFALCVALLTVWWLAKAGVLVLNGQVQGILFILVIGAATDYALLYVARFREAVADGAREVGCHDPGMARSVRADHRLRGNGDRGPAVPACSRTSPRTGRSDRSGRSASRSPCSRP